jgi:hypothetical protein
MSCVDKKAWCVGPDGEPGYGRRQCLVCAKVAAQLKSNPSQSPVPISLPAVQKTTSPAMKAVQPTKPVVTPVKLVSAPPTEKRVFTPTQTASSSQKSTVDNELAMLKALQEARRTPPAALGTKFPYAYRGVRSNPNVYRNRGGFTPHKLNTLELAQSKLKNLANTPTDTLKAAAYRWQVEKSQQDGFFLSTGLSSKEAYDTYPFLYRFNTGALQLREWDEVGFEYQAECVGNCFLYTDNAAFTRARLIAIICLEQGPSRIYELLIMSPVEPKDCEVEDPSGSKNYITFDAWTKKYGDGLETKGT